MLEAEEQKEPPVSCTRQGIFFRDHAHSDQSEVTRSDLSKEYLSSLVIKQTEGSAAQPEHIWKCHGQVLMKCLIPVTQLKKGLRFPH